MNILLRSLCLLTFAAGVLGASIFSFQGTFVADDQVQMFHFSIPSNSTVSLVSWGTGGGTNGAGTLIPPGGFDTNFTLFDSFGTQLATNDDSCAGPAKTIGGCADAFLSATLSAGFYDLALTQSGNPSAGNLSDGFVQQGTGNFTANSGCTQFCDALGNASTGSWAVDIVNVQASTVPEPVTTAFTCGGLALILFLRQRRSRRSSL